ncbi:MAG: FKBP-type peptidyl-prolyl cis-trans isomerase [Bacteroidales bacterium]|nr:FKBP-type peptidyl-prolyl cis-trans isomerase [Bacteroidales bacterium]MDD7727151.1 FKBP-type peptidyl-prolyl cis-trans isomerase [Bacteroidales bacterium]MDY4620026.1 FKBP-type peptidyl-prolyl cis-trans isomerase [Alloprevotella sp.]
MKKLRFLLPLLTALLLVGCQDDLGITGDTDFSTNWLGRNADFFVEKMEEAKTAIAEAKETWGEDWEDHCDWRVFHSFSKPQGGCTVTDSICVFIKERGNGAGSPLYTDSVKVNYCGHLMPTENYPNGKVFDHSGLYESDDYVFNDKLSSPTSFLVSNLVEGYTTALMRMHVGDRWLIYIPQEMGYAGSSSGVLLPYSTLVFDTQLKAYWR